MKKYILIFVSTLGIFIVSVIVYFLLFFFGEKVKIIIPNNYEGPVVIFFDCPNGVSKEYEKHWRILRIPSTGILYTKFKYDMSRMLKGSEEYYFEDESGS